MGIGAIDTTDPLAMRMLGMHGAAFANYAVDDCDFLIAVGARFDDRVAGRAREVRAQRASASRTSTSTGPRSTRSRRAVEPRRPARPRRCEALAAHGRAQAFRRDFGAWARRARRAQARSRHELRPRQRADPAVLRDRGDQPAHPRRGDHHHRRRPAPDVGRAVLRFPRAAAVADLRQHGHHGLRPAGGHRRADRAARSAWSSTSTAMPASA